MKMNIRKIFCGLSAAAIALCTAVPAFADAEEEKVVDPWAISDDSILTDDKSKPSFSFDGSGWKDYVHITPDADGKFSVGSEDTVSYQGISLKITGSADGAPSGMQNFAWVVTDADGNPAFPDANEEDAEFVTMGIEFDAKDFGMNYFDGCAFKFTYRINPDIKSSLMGDSIFAFPADDEYKQVASNMSQIKVNETDSPNTTLYQDKVVPVPTGVGATKFIFEIPLNKAVKSTDLIYIDNLTISANTEALDGKYNGMVVANIDNYNDVAEKKTTPNELQIAEKEEKTESTSEAAAKESTATVPIIIGVVVGVIIVGGVAFFVIKKVRNRYL